MMHAGIDRVQSRTGTTTIASWRAIFVSAAHRQGNGKLLRRGTGLTRKFTRYKKRRAHCGLESLTIFRLWCGLRRFSVPWPAACPERAGQVGSHPAPVSRGPGRMDSTSFSRNWCGIGPYRLSGVSRCPK